MSVHKPRIYTVNVVISNKPRARDPEGETIHRELIAKADYGKVKEVRAAKLLRIKIAAINSEQAKREAWRICNELRIFNPAAHLCKVSVGRLPE